jgi:hypothetical protein
MQEPEYSFQLYFDELIHEHLLKEEDADPAYRRSLLKDADTPVTEYTFNTSSWD